jgi:hypothetical protein
MKIFSLRLPEELHAALKTIAEKEHRSLNAQIIHILEEWLKQFRKSQKP